MVDGNMNWVLENLNYFDLCYYKYQLIVNHVRATGEEVEMREAVGAAPSLGRHKHKAAFSLPGLSATESGLANPKNSHSACSPWTATLPVVLEGNRGTGLPRPPKGLTVQIYC